MLFVVGFYWIGLISMIIVDSCVELSVDVCMVSGGIVFVWFVFGEFGVNGGVFNSNSGSGVFYVVLFCWVLCMWNLVVVYCVVI